MELDPTVVELDAVITQALEFVSAASALRALCTDDVRHLMLRTSLSLSVQSELEDLLGWARPCDTNEDYQSFLSDDDSDSGAPS